MKALGTKSRWGLLVCGMIGCVVFQDLYARPNKKKDQTNQTAQNKTLAQLPSVVNVQNDPQETSTPVQVPVDAFFGDPQFFQGNTASEFIKTFSQQAQQAFANAVNAFQNTGQYGYDNPYIALLILSSCLGQPSFLEGAPLMVSQIDQKALETLRDSILPFFTDDGLKGTKKEWKGIFDWLKSNLFVQQSINGVVQSVINQEALWVLAAGMYTLREITLFAQSADLQKQYNDVSTTLNSSQIAWSQLAGADQLIQILNLWASGQAPSVVITTYLLDLVRQSLWGSPLSDWLALTAKLLTSRQANIQTLGVNLLNAFHGSISRGLGQQQTISIQGNSGVTLPAIGSTAAPAPLQLQPNNTVVPNSPIIVQQPQQMIGSVIGGGTQTQQSTLPPLTALGNNTVQPPQILQQPNSSTGTVQQGVVPQGNVFIFPQQQAGQQNNQKDNSGKEKNGNSQIKDIFEGLGSLVKSFK